MTRCSSEVIKEITNFIKTLYKKDRVPLHEPVFLGREKEYLQECIETTYVSYVGEFVSRFEKMVAEFTGSKRAVAVVNGTAGLHITLRAVGVNYEDEVITQSLTFVATANAISHCGAYPAFVDVDKDTLGMSPESLEYFLKKHTTYDNARRTLINVNTKRGIKAVIPVHVFGHPCRIDQIVRIAQDYGLPVVEDSAEALGSFYKGKHCGTFGLASVISFNGNKIITTGGGGMVLTNDEKLAEYIKHITTTAKKPHPWEYMHDHIGYNYRMPNINAALGVAQMEYLDKILENKRETAMYYREFFNQISIEFFTEPEGARSNYWLNSIFMKDRQERDEFLKYTNANGVMTRPVWRLMHKLVMYENCFRVDLSNSEEIEQKLVNIPSGVRI